MAALLHVSSPHLLLHKTLPFSSKPRCSRDVISAVHGYYLTLRTTMTLASRNRSLNITCSAANKPSPSTEISSTAKIRSEVLSPFRSVRMFFYLAFIASGALGGLIATTRLISALTNPLKEDGVPEILKGLGIDLGAVSIFAFLYLKERSAKNAQLAKLSREERLSNLKLRVDEKKVISVSDLRRIARLVILAGPASYITESFKLSKPFTDSLLDRGVLVVPFATDGEIPSFEFDESNDELPTDKMKKLWQLRPVYTSEWIKWLEEQKKLANVSPEAPVYLSLRMDGRVRGSGIGYPPWNAFSAQLPPDVLYKMKTRHQSARKVEKRGEIGQKLKCMGDPTRIVGKQVENTLRLHDLFYGKL